MPTLRCSNCNFNWPVEEKYQNCVQCTEPTSLVSNIKAMSEEEAQSVWAHLYFDQAKLPTSYDEHAFQVQINKRFTLENWQAEVEAARAKQFEKDRRPSEKSARPVLPSHNPGISRRAPSSV